MTLPDWRTSQAGTRIRAALWLHSEVGVGGTFTKSRLREAFPGVEQIDRRMRDLRPEGWVISTYREDPALDADELRLVAEGGPVWERGYRSQQERRPTDQERRAVLAADNFACVYCGVAGGELYPDDELRSAKLSASRVNRAGDETTSLITLCDRCRAGSRVELVDDDLKTDMARLSPDQFRELARWILADRREWSTTDRLWARYRRLPAADRENFRKAM